MVSNYTITDGSVSVVLRSPFDVLAKGLELENGGPAGIEPATSGLGKLPGHPRSSAVIPDLANGRRFGRVCGHPRSRADVRKRRNELLCELHEKRPVVVLAGIGEGCASGRRRKSLRLIVSRSD